MPTEVQNSYDSTVELVATNPTEYGQRLTITNRIVTGVSLYLKRIGSPNLVYSPALGYEISTVAGSTLVSGNILPAELSSIGTADFVLFTKTITPTFINQEVRLHFHPHVWTASNCFGAGYKNSNVKASESYATKTGTWTDDATKDFAYQYTYTTDLVTTQATTDISGTTATGNGTVNSATGATQHGHCWNTTGTPTTADSKTTNGIPVAGTFTSAITSLTAGTKYYVRAYLTNATSTYYGQEVTFTANQGTVTPTDPVTRVSGIVRTFWSGAGGQASYQQQNFCGGFTTNYISAISPRNIPTIEPTEPTFTANQYAQWLLGLSATQREEWKNRYGSYPSYASWVEWMKQGGTIFGGGKSGGGVGATW